MAKQQGDRAEQDFERGPDVAYERVVVIDQRSRLILVPQFRISVLELQQHALHVVFRLGVRDSGEQSSDNLEVMSLVQRAFNQRQWRPDVDRRVEPELRPGDADNGKGEVAQGDAAAKNLRIGGEALPPECIADHRHAPGVGHHVRRIEPPAKLRLHLKDAEKVF